MRGFADCIISVFQDKKLALSITRQFMSNSSKQIWQKPLRHTPMLHTECSVRDQPANCDTLLQKCISCIAQTWSSQTSGNVIVFVDTKSNIFYSRRQSVISCISEKHFVWCDLFTFQTFFHLSSYINSRNVHSDWSSYQQMNHLPVCFLWRSTDKYLALTNIASDEMQQMSDNSKTVSVIRDRFIAGSNRQRRFKGELFGGPTYATALDNMWFSELQWCWIEIRA